MARSREFLVGTYDRGGGGGLYPLSRSPAGAWSVGEPWREAHNASFGVRSRRFGLDYLVDEMAGTIVACDAMARRVSARVSSGGEQPCHLALDEVNNRLACANYGDGTLAIFPLEPQTGLPTQPPLLHANQGRGADPDRQDGPHAHWVGRDGAARWLYQTDLGTDEIRALDMHRSEQAPHIAFRAPPGSGPRHLAFHPTLPRAYLVSELASSVTTMAVGDGRLEALDVRSTLPVGFEDESLGGHIGFNGAGDRLYVTNREHDSIATFACDTDGNLALLSHVPSQGASPRFLLLLEDLGEMLVANEEGDSVAVFRIQLDGLEPLSTLRLPAPAFVMPI